MSAFFYYLCRDIFLIPLRPFVRVHTSGIELIPRTGAALLLSNHISHFDPPYLAARVPRFLNYMADKPLLEIPVIGRMLKWGFVFPIDRTKNDRGALRTAMARLEAGHLLAIFPEKGIRHGATSVLGGAELPLGTASFWKMMDVPVVPMVILGTDQLYAWKKIWRRPRIFVRAGPMLHPDKNASKEELRDRITAAWEELYEGMVRDYQIRPEELPQSAQERWGQPAPEPPKSPPE